MVRDFKRSDPLRAELFAKLMQTFNAREFHGPKVQLSIVQKATGVEYAMYSDVPTVHFKATLKYLGVDPEERPTA